MDIHNKYQLIIFDWDGTLANNLDNIIACKQEAAADLGIHLADYSVLRSVIGLPFEEAIRLSLPDSDEKVRQQFVQRFDELSQSPRYQEILFPDVDVVLKNLFHKNYKLAIVTSKSRKHLYKALNDTKIGGLFTTTLCSEESKPKPDPEMLFSLMNLLQIPPSQVLMVGDSKTDMQMAMNAGVSAIGITHGVASKDELSAYPNIALIDRITELEQYI